MIYMYSDTEEDGNVLGGLGKQREIGSFLGQNTRLDIRGTRSIIIPTQWCAQELSLQYDRGLSLNLII